MGEAPREPSPAGEPPWPLNRRLGIIGRNLPWARPTVRVAAVMGSDARPLRLWENWRQVIPALNALMDLLPHPATIRPWHYHDDQPSKEIKYGLLRWNETNNRRWTAAMDDSQVYNAKTEVWSPARGGTVQERRDPDLYVQIGSGQLLEEQGFILAIRLELVPALAAAANAVVAAVAATMPDSRTLIADRTWEEKRIAGWVRVNNLDDALTIDAYEWAEANPKRQVAAFGS